MAIITQAGYDSKLEKYIGFIKYIPKGPEREFAYLCAFIIYLNTILQTFGNLSQLRSEIDKLFDGPYGLHVCAERTKIHEKC